MLKARTGLGDRGAALGRIRFRPVAGEPEDYHRSVARVIESDVNEFRLGVVGGNASWTDVFNSTRINELDLGETGSINQIIQDSTWNTTLAFYTL